MECERIQLFYPLYYIIIIYYILYIILPIKLLNINFKSEPYKIVFMKHILIGSKRQCTKPNKASINLV